MTGQRVDPDPVGRPRLIVAAGLVNLAIGVWLLAAPGVLEHAEADASWNDRVFGALLASFAFARVLGSFREAWLSGLNLAIGVWLILAALVLHETDAAVANAAVCGVLVVTAAAASLAASPTRDRP